MKTFELNEQNELHLDCNGQVAIGLRFNKETNKIELIGAIDGYGNSIYDKIKEYEK